MSLSEETKSRIQSMVEQSNVVLFMKGTPAMPQCGFSATVVQILSDVCGSDFETVNVLADPEVREGVKLFSQWPTIPQLYINQEFVGGCDIVKDMYASGDLHAKMGLDMASMDPPAVTVTQSAAAALQAAAGEASSNDVLHLTVSAQFETSLNFAPKDEKKFSVESAGVHLLVDRSSAKRADGMVVDFVDGPDGKGFKVENPNAPKPAANLTPTEVKAKLDSGESFLFLDCRTPEERATASIDGTKLLEKSYVSELLSMDKDTVLVFHCHHGGRSQGAADHFAKQGFRRVYNMAGGIDAWSQEVDSSVPRY